MKFSVIVPMHNCAKWVRKGLQSLRDQEFKDYEIICVLDSCEDGSERLAKMFGDKVIKVNNHLMGPTINAGIEAAEGDYILFMDDDDWYLHEYAFSLIAKATEEVPNADIIAYGFIFRHQGYASPRSNDGMYWPAVWNKCWKRSFIGDTRFGDEQYGSDLYFTNRMLAKQPMIAEMNFPMYYYNYMRDGSLTDKLQKGEVIHG